MKHAVIIGAGNIGRGFVGQLFSEAGWEVCFLDVSAPLVDALNEAGSYPLEIVSNTETVRKTVSPVRAVNGNDREAAARVTADADVCVTCVGAKALKYIVPNLAAGVRLRAAEGKGPLNLLICENLMDADALLCSLLEPVLTAEETDTLGLVETSVGRMVPLPDKSLTEKDPLLVRAESYGVLPFDGDAWKGPLPDVPGLKPVSPFRFIVERKLWVHNMGHAVCAYLGTLRGYRTVAESVGDPWIRIAVREAMISSVRALAKRYGQPLDPLLAHTEDLIRRFGNRALGDTCARVGNDVPRKLAKSDRLTGAALCIEETGARPVWLSLGAAAAMRVYEQSEDTDFADAATAFEFLTGVTDGAYREDTLRFYELLRENGPLSDAAELADAILSAHTQPVM
jgi:mannitol-1-phosphate 5-dehydrogenase